MHYNRDELFGDTTRKIMDYTDSFFVPYVLSPVENASASKDAFSTLLNLVEGKNNYPLSLSQSFDRERDRIIDLWKKQREALLLKGKYSWEFEDYCLKNGYATKNDKGIIVSKDLAFIYMSFLADWIAKNNYLDMATDIYRHTDYLISKEQATYKHKLERLIDKLYLVVPINIQQIPLDRIIELRGKSEYNDARRQFAKSLNKWLSETENGDERSFAEFNSCKKEIKDVIYSTFGTVANVIITINKLCHTDISFLQTLQTSAGVYNEGSRMAKSVNAIREKYMARRYLTVMENYFSAD